MSGADVNAQGEQDIHGSQINTTVIGPSSQMALMLVAERGKCDIGDILIEHSADVNVKGEKFVCHSP